MNRSAPGKKELIAIGSLASLMGFYFLLVGADILPLPGGADKLHGPLWIVLCVGLAFFLAGVAMLLQAFGHANDRGEFPAEAPTWLRVTQYLIGLTIFATFGAIGSWIAFGPGERAFSGSLPFISGESGSAVGRTIFGIGAIIVWFGTVAFAVVGASKLLGRGKRDARAKITASKGAGIGHMRSCPIHLIFRNLSPHRTLIQQTGPA